MTNSNIRFLQNIEQARRPPLLIGFGLTILWIVGVAAYFYVVPQAVAQVLSDPGRLILMAVSVLGPILFIWFACLVAATLRTLRVEATELRFTVEAVQANLKEGGGKDSGGISEAWVQSQLEHITKLTAQTESRISEIATKGLAASPPPKVPRDRAAAITRAVHKSKTDLDQVELPLPGNDPITNSPISVKEFIVALNFPRSASDSEGFRILRKAFGEREVGQLLHASQDVLTLLSQDGIYMDDLAPENPAPGLWRRYADGERGRTVRALGNVWDRSALALAESRMKNDDVFKDAAHQFLRQFDRVLKEFVQTAEDIELAEMGKTRSARAFMMLGRITGSFD